MARHRHPNRALAEQGRRHRQYEAGFETSLEPIAFARLCEAKAIGRLPRRTSRYATSGQGDDLSASPGGAESRRPLPP
jgi:hypothetical protein